MHSRLIGNAQARPPGLRFGLRWHRSREKPIWSRPPGCFTPHGVRYVPSWRIALPQASGKSRDDPRRLACGGRSLRMQQSLGKSRPFGGFPGDFGVQEVAGSNPVAPIYLCGPHNRGHRFGRPHRRATRDSPGNRFGRHRLLPARFHTDRFRLKSLVLR